MNNFRTIDLQLFYSFPIQVEEQDKLDQFLSLLESSGVQKYLSVHLDSESKIGRPTYDPHSLFAAILLGFSIGKASLREIETSCKNDLRFIYVMRGTYPSYSTISRFIQEVVAPQKEQIFACITKAIFEKCHLTMDPVFLDGTKQEAKANKYKFVWKPTKFHERLSDKVRSLLSTIGLEKDVPSEGILPSVLIMRKIEEAENLPAENIKGGSAALSRIVSHLFEYLLKAIDYEEKERICGANRNSYFKTDHDATAMCLKTDFYSGLGSNMHAAYSVQIIVSHGFILCYYISQDRSDFRSLQPAIQNFYSMYNVYPKRLGADSGYGNLENYEFCEAHNIRAFVKYLAWNGESSGRNPSVYEYLNDGTIRCLGNRIGHVVELNNRHPKKAGAVFYQIFGCTGCEFMPYCRRFMKEKVSDEKIFEVQPRYMKLKQQARDLLLTPEGIEMRINRSCQVEGAFGNIKQNMAYTRFRRTSLDRVSTEFALTCLGLNLRKFMRFASTGKLPKYWVAPLNLPAGSFKKPSAKRLTNRVNRKRSLPPNEALRSSYKYKN